MIYAPSDIDKNSEDFDPSDLRDLEIGGIETNRISYGNYSKEQIIGTKIRAGEDFDHLISREGLMEFAISYHINERRKKLKLKTPGSGLLPPVIALDIGATQGHTMVYLAKRFRKELLAGELVLVCSNLTHMPNAEYERYSYDTEGEKISDNNLKHSNNYYSLITFVNWVNCPIQDLQFQTVTDAKGFKWILKGNVNVANERSVLMHVKDDSTFPLHTQSENKQIDLAVHMITDLLTNNGMSLISQNPLKYNSFHSPQWDAVSDLYNNFIANDPNLVKAYLKAIKPILLKMIKQSQSFYNSPEELAKVRKSFGDDFDEIVKQSQERILAIEKFVTTF